MEYLDIIDENGNLTGKQKPRNDVHASGMLHHASGLIIYRRLVSGGGTNCSLNNVLLKKIKTLGFGICQLLVMFQAVKLQSVH